MPLPAVLATRTVTVKYAEFVSTAGETGSEPAAGKVVISCAEMLRIPSEGLFFGPFSLEAEFDGDGIATFEGVPVCDDPDVSDQWDYYVVFQLDGEPERSFRARIETSDPDPVSLAMKAEITVPALGAQYARLNAAQVFTGANEFTQPVTIPEAEEDDQAATRAFVLAQVASGTPDATDTVKGKLRLTNHLSGTADAPTVPGLATKADTTAVNSALALKADTSTVDTALSTKADTSSVTASLATKADTSALTAGLATKADAAATTAALATKALDSAVLHLTGDESATGIKTLQRLIIELADKLNPGLIIRQQNNVTSTSDTELLQILYKTFKAFWANEKGLPRARRVAAEIVMKTYGRASDPDAVNTNDLEQWFDDNGGADRLAARLGGSGGMYHKWNDFSAWTAITIDTPTTALKYTANVDGTSGYNSPQLRVVDGGRYVRMRGRINVAAVTGVADEIIASGLPTSLARLGMTSEAAWSSVPPMHRHFAGGYTGSGAQRLRVNNTGTLQALGTVAGGSGVWISLDNCGYSLEA